MTALNEEALNRIFLDGRTHNGWLDTPVTDEVLHHLYDLMKWGPTSANCSPARIVFVKSPDAKEKLLQCVMPGNVEKTKTAPAH
jgi:3-hydroxypropanoate dehydrogenase